MDWLTLVLFVLGFVLLVGGAELLVRGASRLALAVGISPLVVGLTVVAFGTSAPELAISSHSALNGQPDIALGNVIGSNIANVLLILGISALIAPIVVSRQIIWQDVPLMIGASLLVLVLVLDGAIGRLDGLFMILLLVVYVTVTVSKSRRETAQEQEEFLKDSGLDVDPEEQPHWFRQAFLIVIGLVLLVIGAQWLVDGAVAIARLLGLSELVIGLTIIAIGTSLPEVAASISACLHKQQDLIVGNVVGSNLFNILLVLGAAAVLAPGGIPVPQAALSFDIPVMLAVSFACLPIFFTGHLIERWEGVLFLAYYSAYLVYLVFNATQHYMLPAFSNIMLWFVLPLTALTLLVLLLHALRIGNPPRHPG